jgi:hypothetical protein
MMAYSDIGSFRGDYGFVTYSTISLPLVALLLASERYRVLVIKIEVLLREREGTKGS